MRKIQLIICLLLISCSAVFSKGGTIRLLIARPNNFDYTVNPKTMWVSSLTESFLYFRLDAVDKVKMISIGEITPLVSSHRDFTKRVGKSKYISAGKELLATHVLYIEYEITPAKQLKLYFTVEYPDKSQKPVNSQALVPLGDMNAGLTDAVRGITKTLGVTGAEMPGDFFSINILGTDAKNTKRLGEHLIKEKGSSKAALGTLGSNCEKITNSEYSMYLAYYAGSRLYAKAGRTEDALRLMQGLVDKLEDRYPKLHLQLATLFRKSGKLNDAKSSIDRLGRNPSLRNAVLWEKGFIYESMGNYSVAEQTFRSLEAVDNSDPLVYLYLAKISMAQGKMKAADQYAAKAAKLSGKTHGKIYYEMGKDYAQAKNQTNAIKAYTRSVTVQPDFTVAWHALGDMQVKAGQDSAAAISYLNCFKLDYIKYEGYLEKAGKLLEKKGLIELAKNVYTVSFEKHGDPKIAIMLARLEYRQGKYKKVKQLLEPLGDPWIRDNEVISMLDKATEDKVAPVMKLKGQNPMIIKAGSGDYVEPGVTATDNEDGDLSMHVEISGTVKTTVLDTYIITYRVSDVARNVTTKTRTVIVSDDEPPVVELIGETQIRLITGDRFRDPGARGYDSREGDLSSRIVTTGTVNTSRPGTYTLTYIVKDAAGNSSVPKKRTVIVAGDSVPPTITLIGGSPMHLVQGERYKEPGAMAKDNRDGNISSRVSIKGTVNTNVLGSYKITYTVKDNSGNIATEERVVNVREPAAPIDSRSPVIKLIGGSPNTIYEGDTYEEPGVNATDDVDGDLTAFINIEGEVNPSVAGNYTITYSVSDKSGNKSKKVLRVRVRSRKVSSVDQRPREPRTERPSLIPPREKRARGKSKRKPVLGVLSGLGCAGTFLAGVIFNSQVTTHYNDWVDLDEQYKKETDPDKKKELEEARDSKKSKAETSRLLRNLSYIGTGTFGLVFILNIVIPSKK